MHRTVYRTESEHSEDSSAKRVSFKKDITVKHIPRGTVVDRQGYVVGYIPDSERRYNVYKEPPRYDEEDLAKEAERILKQVQNADCIVTGAPVVFDTKSLDRPKKKKNNTNQEQINTWSKTLPSTKNKLDSKSKKKDLVEKNNKLNALKSKLLRTNSGSGEVLDTIHETSKETLNNSYLKDVERNNLRFSDKQLPAKISNEEIFYQRQKSSEYIDRMPGRMDSKGYESDRYGSPPRSYRYSEERDDRPSNPALVRQRSYSRNETDPLHSMPGGLIEPIYALGFTHNRNRPFSYTAGMSPEVKLQARRYDDESFKPHYQEDRNIYHSTQKVMEKESILPNKSRAQRDSGVPLKENNSRSSSVDQMPSRYEFRRENPQLQSKKPSKKSEPSLGRPPSERVPNKNGIESKDTSGYTTKIMINVDQRRVERASSDLNSASLVRQASDASQAMGIQSSRLVRQAQAEPPPRPLRAKEKKVEATVDNHRPPPNRVSDKSRLSDRTATLGRVPSQREQGDKRDKKRKVKIVFEYKKAPEPEGDPLSRFVEYKGSDTRFSRPMTKEVSSKATLERRQYDEDAIRRHKSEQRFAEEALLEYERRARSLSPEKVPPSSYDDPEREERIRRQRDKFLTAIFGPGKIPGVMSDENVARDESPEAKYRDDDRRRVLSNPDLTSERRRRVNISVSPEREERPANRKSTERRYDRREGYGKNRSPDRMETSESDENNRANMRRSRVDLAGSLTPPSDYDSSSYSSSEKHGAYWRGGGLTRYGETRSGNPVWIMTVKSSRDNLERRNSDFSESERDYRREMATKKPSDTTDSGNWNSLTLNRLEVKNKKNRDVPVSRTLDRSETLRKSRGYSSSELVDERYDKRYEDEYQDQVSERLQSYDPLEHKENRKTLRYFGDTDLESERNSMPYKPVLKPEPSVRRTASSVSNTKGPKMDYLKPPKLIPNSLSSSLNSSESEAGEGGSQAASASSQRSVYLHATTVADIPVPGYPSQRRREDSSDGDGAPSSIHPVSQAHGAQLKNARHVSRSFSVLTPWKPRHYREKFEINYSNQQGPQPAQPTSGPHGKPPRPPRKREVDDEETPAASQKTSRQVKVQPKETTKVSGWFKRKKQTS